jgi:hypothetical protein
VYRYEQHCPVARAAGATLHPGQPPETDVRVAGTLSGLAGAWLGAQSRLRAVRDRTVVFPGAVRTVLACVGVSRHARRETA